MFDDSICAIATAFGNASISVIRVSGSECINQVNQVFKGYNLPKAKKNTIHYGYIVDEEKQVIDEVMVSVFLAPNSFTAENSIEISCHGGMLVTQKVLERLFSIGVRLAQPGEFSKRAYLNGRIDLTQAEAIMDLIHASNENALRVATNSLKKSTTKLIKSLKAEILSLIAQVEVNIDYPEYDDAIVMNQTILYPKTLALLTKIDDILERSKKTRIIKEGVKTAIIGRPNVGKSSLLNALLDEDRAIVSEYEGTTRDTIDAQVNLKGITLHLIDTAGIRESTDFVEKIGIERSIKTLNEAELILLVLDQSQALSKADLDLLELTKDHLRVIIGNKADLGSTLKLDEMISISSLKRDGLNHLEEIIIKKLNLDQLKQTDFNYLSNSRHIQKLKEARQALIDAKKSMEDQLPIDLTLIDLTQSYHQLGEILGNHNYTDLLDELFSKFCLGK